MHTSDFKNLNLIKRGKVRDIYDLGQYLLFVASDRISAFDVVMNEIIPRKGEILSKISVFWFEQTKHLVKNHFITNNVEEYPAECRPYISELANRSMLVEKCKPLEIECIVRGYITGSGWKEYLRTGTICGIELPKHLLEFQKLPTSIFTPSTKAEVGHDENIDFNYAAKIVGLQTAETLRNLSLELYEFGRDYLDRNNLILADTKFEFGTNSKGEIVLIDEVLTPDSSRFWLKETYAPGVFQTNFDKQILRDYLLGLDWDKKAPPPSISEEIVEKTRKKYEQAAARIINGK